MLNTAEIGCLIAGLDLEQNSIVTGAFKFFQGELKFLGKHSLQKKSKLLKSHHKVWVKRGKICEKKQLIFTDLNCKLRYIETSLL